MTVALAYQHLVRLAPQQWKRLYPGAISFKNKKGKGTYRWDYQNGTIRRGLTSSLETPMFKEIMENADITTFHVSWTKHARFAYIDRSAKVVSVF
jgi:hypothetical protein